MTDLLLDAIIISTRRLIWSYRPICIGLWYTASFVCISAINKLSLVMETGLSDGNRLIVI